MIFLEISGLATLLTMKKLNINKMRIVIMMMMMMMMMMITMISTSMTIKIEKIRELANKTTATLKKEKVTEKEIMSKKMKMMA